jgi:ABC-type branched-subunit amino acid transport system permease subunit
LSSHLQYLLLGTGAGAVIAALALGIVLTYRASGVVNFAHAAMGMFLAYTYGTLRQSGEVLNPLLVGPSRIPLLPSCSTDIADATCTYRFAPATAFAITMALAAIYGLVVYLLAFRPLRSAPTLAKVVASLGLFLYLLAIANMRIGSQGAALSLPENLLPSSVVRLAGVDIQQDRLWLALVVVVVTALLAALYRFTRFGLATRAAAESEKGAVLLGISPDRVAALNWMLGTMLAGGAVILFAPITSINPATTSLLFVPALAAALIGRFRSFGITAVAGLGIGMLQSEIANIHGSLSWLPQVNWQAGLPFLIIIATMAIRGDALAARGSLGHGHFPTSPRPRRALVWIAVLSTGGVVALLTLDSVWRGAIIVSATTAVIALSVVVLTGYVGQISLMPMALAGISAFAMVRFTAGWHIPFPIAPVLAGLLAVAIGVVVGLPAVRVRGMNLAIATLAAATAIEELILKWTWFTGGEAGSTVESPTLFGLDLGISAPGAANNRAAFGILCIIVLALIALVVVNLRISPTGLHWLGVRANERAAASIGTDTTRTKLMAFAVSSFIAGIGGALYAYGHPNLSAGSFTVFASLALIALVYLGGIASVAGALVAGVLAEGGIASAGQTGSQTQFAISGVALIAVAVLYPNGISGGLYALRDRITQRWSRPSPADDAPPVTTSAAAAGSGATVEGVG